MRQDFAFGKLAYRSPQLLLFVCQCKFHVASPIKEINTEPALQFISQGYAHKTIVTAAIMAR
jgi:hypothetical protein